MCGWHVVIALKTGEREDRYESAIADLKARLKNVRCPSFLLDVVCNILIQQQVLHILFVKRFCQHIDAMVLWAHHIFYFTFS